jgi:hypothetical protein
MAAPSFLAASPATAGLALVCVVAGGPWFADGLRALRARRALRRLTGTPSRTLRDGLVHVVGRVETREPLVAPLSGRPCAHWQLDVRDARGLFVASVGEQRPFAIEVDGELADVTPGAEWRITIGAERSFASTHELGASLDALLERVPELRWLRHHGGAVTMVERALFADADAHVIGHAVRGAAVESLEWNVLERTGTDGVAWTSGTPEPAAAWHIGLCPELEACFVGDHALAPGTLAPAAWRTCGALLGPVLSLAGLVVLADSAGRALDGRL